jgi:peptidyl-prolyl cis-trans isomerase A (cyclophilin A)
MNRYSLTTIAILGATLTLLGCSKSEPRPEKPPAEAPALPASVAAAAPVTEGALDGNAPIFHPEKATEQAPDTYKVKFTTTKGDFVIAVTRAWSPNGADRFYNLVKLGYYDGTRFFRAVEGFMVQWGIHGNPSVNGAWMRASISDDPVVKSNKRGFVTFATAGPNMRTTQIFINYQDKNARLDARGFSPFGEVTEGMSVVDGLFKGYGEGAPGGKGPRQDRIGREGNVYLDKEFPELDAVKTARIL